MRDSCKSRRGGPRSDTRTARLVYPMRAPAATLVPVVTPESIEFMLPPGRDDLNFTFQMRMFAKQNVFMRGSGILGLTFRINGVLFEKARFPCDVSKAVVSGVNWIAFGGNFGPTPLKPELCFDVSRDIESMVARVVSNGRGTNVVTETCTHVESFEIWGFMRRAITTGVWTCPVCGAPAGVEQLRHILDHELDDGLDNIDAFFE